MENKLLQGRISMLLSQIQPHFLNNTLTVIADLCRVNGDTAKDALIELTRYLRANMDTLGGDMLIPFAEELEHTRIYLTLERLRFHERLKVVYQVNVISFPVPPLALQPIVENAVRYGIMQREEGVTVTISTEETQTQWLVIVEDDGPGFDTEDLSLRDGARHVGIYNVEQRVKYMCGGSLELLGEKGKGTRAVIRLPKGGMKIENDCG